MHASEFRVCRAWSGHIAEGLARDHFANLVAFRIHQESHDSEMAGYPAELVGDFVDRCDSLFEAASPEPTTGEEIESLAWSVEINALYDLVECSAEN